MVITDAIVYVNVYEQHKYEKCECVVKPFAAAASERLLAQLIYREGVKCKDLIPEYRYLKLSIDLEPGIKQE